MGVLWILVHLLLLLVIADSSHSQPGRHGTARTGSIYGPLDTQVAPVSTYTGGSLTETNSWRGPSSSFSSTMRRAPSGYSRRGITNITPQRFRPPRPLATQTLRRNLVRPQVPTMSVNPRLRRNHFLSRTSGNTFRNSQFTQSVNTRIVNESPTRGITGIRDMAGNNILALLIKSRENSTRTIEDEIAISRHLMKIEEIRRQGDTAAGTTLERQIRYIETVADRNVQRESLKLFVKDIVEKSGFLSQAADLRSPDIDKIMSLVDMITKITDRFNRKTSTAATDQSAQRISNTILGFQNNLGRETVNPFSSFKSRFSLGDSLGSFSSVRDRTKPSAATVQDRIRLMVGHSIYGGPSGSFLRQESRSTITTPKPTVDKREPVGGNGGYWTHLRSGLADLLCRLCQQHRNEACILRYCNANSNGS